MTTLDAKQFQFLIILLWNVWNRRNRWVHQNQLLPTKMVAEYAQLLAGEYQAANDRRSQVEQVTSATQRWTFFSLLGNCTAMTFLVFSYGVDSFGSRLCESRVRPSLGHRCGRYATPSPGGRNLGRHCRQAWNETQSEGRKGRCGLSTHLVSFLQDLFRRLVSSDRYKVGFTRVLVFGVYRKHRYEGFVGFHLCLISLFGYSDWYRLKEDSGSTKELRIEFSSHHGRINHRPIFRRVTLEHSMERAISVSMSGGSFWNYKRKRGVGFRICGRLKLRFWSQFVLQMQAMVGRNRDRGRKRRKKMITCLRKENFGFTWLKAELEISKKIIGWLGSTGLTRSVDHHGPGHEGILTWANYRFPRFCAQHPDSPIISGAYSTGSEWSHFSMQEEVNDRVWLGGAHKDLGSEYFYGKFKLIYVYLHGITFGKSDYRTDYVTRREKFPCGMGPSGSRLETLDIYLKRFEGRRSFRHLYEFPVGLWSLLDTSARSRWGKAFTEYRDFLSTVFMAEEVAGLMENLKFSEEEMVDVSADGEGMFEPLEGSEKWVGPFQFGEWLKVDLAKGQGTLRKKQGIVYANRDQGLLNPEGSGEHLIGSQEVETCSSKQRDRGKSTGIMSSVPRAVKRTLKGKNEVCNPIAPKKSKTVSVIGRDEDEFSEASSPIKFSAPTVEAGCQPRRES
ncbi:hypothetical protein V6N12_009502 [Hibiscus sabdariffa]|uniref:Uncharacterized protein n=1 Tax=Hibiscus sabdariffa TaxID=183260 RepID=A0ABR2E9B4_9ROSI